MRRKSRRKKREDPFGLNRLTQRMTLSSNVMRGRMAENEFEMSQRLQGHDVKKIHKGGDFVVQKKDFFGRKIGKPKTYEIKAGGSRLSKVQKKKKRKLKRKYEVVRY